MDGIFLAIPQISGLFPILMKFYLLPILGIFCLQYFLHAEMREWTSADDPSKKIKGEFRGRQGNMVALRLDNGRMVKFEITKLCAADQEYIRNGGKPVPFILNTLTRPCPLPVSATAVRSRPHQDFRTINPQKP